MSGLPRAVFVRLLIKKNFTCGPMLEGMGRSKKLFSRADLGNMGTSYCGDSIPGCGYLATVYSRHHLTRLIVESPAWLRGSGGVCLLQLTMNPITT